MTTSSEAFGKWMAGEEPKPAPVSVDHEPPAPLTPSPMKVSVRALALAALPDPGPQRARVFRDYFPIPKPPPAIDEPSRLALDGAKQAMDSSLDWLYSYAGLYQFGEGIRFAGYPYLAELTQRPEYRMITETIATEMTRKWIRLTYDGKAPKKSSGLGDLEDCMEHFDVQGVYRRCAENDGFFGRAHSYYDTGAEDDPTELALPLIIDKAKIAKGGLKDFRAIEPMWTYPNGYNAADPLREDYFRPSHWLVQGKAVHRSRLPSFVGREVPDILKPAYAFGGLSMSQMAKPYVDNWLRTRQSVSDLVHSFSIIVLKMNMGEVLEEGAATELLKRITFFNSMRDNKGAHVIDKESEDVVNLSVPLTTIDSLQAQAQEQLASVSGIPLVKLLGITPSGLNNSSDEEIRVFYDRMHAFQERLFARHLRTTLKVIQLHATGKIDPKVGFDFVPMWQLDEAAKAAVRKTQADTAIEYVNAGVIDPEEERQRLTEDDESPYNGIDPADVPDSPAMQMIDATQGEVGGNPAKTAEPKKLESSGV